MARACGSSPLARGLPTGINRSRTWVWIIPARAGFTRQAPLAPIMRVGSSPLARGLLRGRIHRRDHVRIIPARAGFTSGTCSGPPSQRIIPARAGFTLEPADYGHHSGDHPRSRGVYGTATATDDGTGGSSPLARGLLNGWHHDRGQHRIIPARAGFTPITPRRARTVGDHPRSRGVYKEGVHALLRRIGSSPLARGLQLADVGLVALLGIIPARAGFTRAGMTRDPTGADHPRSRGVYQVLCRGRRWWVGSSPLARGLPDVNRQLILLQGSSPLARGLRYRPRGARPGDRIIPARAGFTGSSHLRVW